MSAAPVARRAATLGLLLSALAPRAAAGVAGVPPPVAIPRRLGLEEAIRIFRGQGLDLLIADAAVAGAEADVASAGATPNPTLAAVAGSSLSSPQGAWSFGLSDQNALSDRLNGKRRLRLAVAGAALGAARMNRADAQRTLEYQLKQQYIQAVFARDSLDFSLEVQRSATETLDLTAVRYRSGAISEADLAKVETAKLEADQAVTSARLGLQSAKDVLAFLLGARGAPPDFQVAQDLPRYEVPPALARITRDALLRLAFDHRADLKAARYQNQRAAAAAGLARRLAIPDVALQVSQYGQGSGPSAVQPPTVTVGVSLPLPLLYRYRGEVARAEAEARAQALLAARAEAQVLADVETAYASFLAARELVERMQGGLLDRAGRARDLIALQYRKGAASLLEYLDAQRTYIAANVEYLQDLAGYWIAVFQLEQATATELRS